MKYFALCPLFPAERTNFGTAVMLTRGDRWDLAPVEKCVLKVLARIVLTGGAFSCTITGMTYLYGLSLLILALWLASEIVARDLSSPAPKDPYRLDRWREGEGDPDQ